MLGIRLTHSKPGQPQGRGKIERVFRTVREQFLVELEAHGGAADLAELNRLFGAWVEGVYHQREHTETGQAPIQRFGAGAPPRLPTPDQLREAFLWAEHRQVTKTAQVSLFGNRYQVDPALVGATVELVFDPFDLAKIQVRYQHRPMGTAVGVQLGRHVHPAAKPEGDPTVQATPQPSGIDYLAMVEQRTAGAQRRRIAYAELADSQQASALPGLDAPQPTPERRQPHQPAPDPAAAIDTHSHPMATTPPSAGALTAIAPAPADPNPSPTTTIDTPEAAS